MESWNPPSAEECDTNAIVQTPEGPGTAFWHPQWGGYTGKAIMLATAGVHCFDVYVWHDGEFARDDAPPSCYHYCDSDQLRRMADLADRLASLK